VKRLREKMGNNLTPKRRRASSPNLPSKEEKKTSSKENRNCEGNRLD